MTTTSASVTNSVSVARADERLDEIVGTTISLWQKTDGTAFAVDTLLLADFVEFSPDWRRVADLGSGSGVLSFMMAFRNPALQIVGYEVQEEMLRLAARNLHLNPQYGGISWCHRDIRDIPRHDSPGDFDLVLANPPYFPRGSGRLPPAPCRAAARHELHGNLLDFVLAAAFLLAPGGRVCFVVPAPRCSELETALTNADLGLRRQRFILPKVDQPAHLTLLEAEKHFQGSLQVLPSLPLREANGLPSPYLAHLLQFGLTAAR